MNNPKYIIIHHSKSTDYIVRDFRALKKYHVEVKGWDDIAYHYVIERVEESVQIINGRKPYKEGAHALGFNSVSLGICVVGDYDLYGWDIPKIQKLIELVKALRMIFDIPRDKVIGHRETYGIRGMAQQKTCPGKKIFMEDLRMAV